MYAFFMESNSPYKTSDVLYLLFQNDYNKMANSALFLLVFGKNSVDVT